MVARRAAPTSGTSRSRRQTSRFITVIRRIGDVATTVAVRGPPESTAISPSTSPGPSVRITVSLRTTFAVPSEDREHRVAEIAFGDERLSGPHLEIGAYLCYSLPLLLGHVCEERNRREAR
jgi:hypothetical protein